MMRTALLAITVLLLDGCASARHYPSLAPRAAEKRGFAEPVTTSAVVPPDPVLDARIAEQSAALARIAAGFTSAADMAHRSADAAKRQPIGSEAWLTAQAALARVDDWRAQASALASNIEAAGSARAAQLLPSYAALDALRERAAAETDREADVAARTQALLPGS